MIELRQESPDCLEAYAEVPIAFEVRSLLEVSARDAGLRGLSLTERVVATPYTKDYDALPGNHPRDWPHTFDVTRWGVLSSWTAGQRIGGAVIAFGSADVELLAGRDDLASLWDLRVRPDHRRRGHGQALFSAAAQWARSRGCRWLKIETQNINVPACRLYASLGCTLGALDRFAYPTLPDEIQLLWYHALDC